MAHYLSTLNSTARYVTIPVVTLTGDFVIEWIGAIPVNGIFAFAGNGVSGGNGIDLYRNNSGKYQIFLNSQSQIVSTTNASNSNDTPDIVRVERVGSTFTLRVNGVSQGTFSLTPLEVKLERIFHRAGWATYGNQALYSLTITGSTNLNYDTNASGGTGTILPETVSGQNGTQGGTWPADDSEWVPYSTGTVPVAFTGTIPNQSATVGVPFSLDVASYFTGTLTPFTYALATGNLTGTGLSRTGSVISGTPTSASTISGLSISATDTGSNVATSNTFSIVVAAGGDTTPPTFTVAPAVTSITQTTATATATINETGNIYYVIVPQAQATPSGPQVKAGQNSSGGAPVESGSALATTTISDPVSGLAAGAPYKMCMVAEDDESPPNIQAAVTTVNFTTSAVAVGTITSQPLSRNNGVTSGVVALTYIDVDNPATGALVLRKTGVSTNGSGVFTFSDAVITAGTEYRINWLEAGGQFGTAFVVAS